MAQKMSIKTWNTAEDFQCSKLIDWPSLLAYAYFLAFLIAGSMLLVNSFAQLTHNSLVWKCN